MGVYKEAALTVAMDGWVYTGGRYGCRLVCCVDVCGDCFVGDVVLAGVSGSFRAGPTGWLDDFPSPGHDMGTDKPPQEATTETMKRLKPHNTD